MENKPPKIACVASLKGFPGVILGRDLGGILQPGKLYAVRNIMGTIMLDEIGDHYVSPQTRNSRIDQIAVEGLYLHTPAEIEEMNP